jgi:hypothetical protein
LDRRKERQQIIFSFALTLQGFSIQRRLEYRWIALLGIDLIYRALINLRRKLWGRFFYFAQEMVLPELEPGIVVGHEVFSGNPIVLRQVHRHREDSYVLCLSQLQIAKSTLALACASIKRTSVPKYQLTQTQMFK